MTPRQRPEQLARVAARIREDLAAMERIVTALRDVLQHLGPEDPGEIHVHWTGGLVHDFYTALEKVFRGVSPDLNGLRHDPESWHRDLLHAMTLDLPGFRPPVIRGGLEPRLLELMRFRHVYRNVYSFDLRWDRVRQLAEEALAIWPEVSGDLAAFATALDDLARA